jgi:hypothetical protein
MEAVSDASICIRTNLLQLKLTFQYFLICVCMRTCEREYFDSFQELANLYVNLVEMMVFPAYPG